MNAVLCVLLAVLMLRPDQIEWLKEDWTRPVEHVLGVNQWEGQQRVVRALQKHRRVAVPSGHKVGKTHLVGSLCCAIMALHPNARIITTAGTFDQVKENVWGEIREQHKGAKIPLGGQLLPRAPEWINGPLWYCKGISTDNPESFQGKHSEEGLVFVVMDECQSIPREIVTAALTMTSDANGYFLAIANPTIPSGWFYDACTTDPRFHVERLSVMDHPNIVQGKKVMPGPTQGLVDQFIGTSEEGPRLTGHFNTAVGDRVILLSILEQAAEVNAASLEDDGIHIGVDIADSGGDECVACVMENRSVIDEIVWRNPDRDGLMKSAGQILEVAAQHGVSDDPWRVHVDGIGVGAGVVARLHEQGFTCEDVQAGGSPEGDWDRTLGDFYEFANRKAELWWVARTLFEKGGIHLPTEYRQIRADLAAPGWDFLSDRKVRIEAKKDVKKRIGRSPDRGDAFILALSRASAFAPRIRRLI